jgi:hypothetical protein
MDIIAKRLMGGKTLDETRYLSLVQDLIAALALSSRSLFFLFADSVCEL